MSPLIIGVAGGSGSGKSTVVRLLLERLGEDQATVLEQDAHYLDLAHLSHEERARQNFDHPASLDRGVMAGHIADLRAGRAVQVPEYDFAGHTRKASFRRVEPRPCVLVEGTLVLAMDEVREGLDLRLFVQTDGDVRLLRRLRRDVAERGRTTEDILRQWEETVAPMYRQFVEPSARHAHLVLPEAGFESALDILSGYLRHR